MNRTLPLLILVAALLLSCSGDPRGEADRSFEGLTDRFLQQYLRMYPEEATALGDHRYDHLLDDYSAEGVTAAVNLFRAYRDTLRGIRVATLSAAHMITRWIAEYFISKHCANGSGIR